MDEAMMALARIGAAAACAGENEVEEEARAALAAGVDLARLRETLLQAYLFVGYPRAINALVALNRAAGEGAGDADREPLEPDLDRWRERGEELCRRIYGGGYERLRANIAALHPDLASWMLVEGYGKVLSRPGMDARERELAVLGILAADGQLRQLDSHVRGALRVGASVDEVRGAVAAGAERANAELGERVSALVDRIVDEWEG